MNIGLMLILQPVDLSIIKMRPFFLFLEKRRRIKKAINFKEIEKFFTMKYYKLYLMPIPGCFLLSLTLLKDMNKSDFAFPFCLALVLGILWPLRRV